MAKRKLSRWRITRLKASPAALIGYVEAPDQEQAIRTAIRKFAITNPEHPKAVGGATGGIGAGYYFAVLTDGLPVRDCNPLMLL